MKWLAGGTLASPASCWSRQTSYVFVPDGKSGHQVLLWGAPLEGGKIIAVQGEMGPQAKLLSPGLHVAPFYNLFYDVEMKENLVVPSGMCVTLVAADGLTLPPARPSRNISNANRSSAWPRTQSFSWARARKTRGAVDRLASWNLSLEPLPVEDAGSQGRRRQGRRIRGDQERSGRAILLPVSRRRKSRQNGPGRAPHRNQGGRRSAEDQSVRSRRHKGTRHSRSAKASITSTPNAMCSPTWTTSCKPGS